MKLLIQWAFTSSALILIVLAARHLFRKKLSARLKYALWGVVLLRLLAPFQVELPAASGVLPVLASNLAPEVADVELYALRTYSHPLSEDSLAEMREGGIDSGTVLATQAPIYTFGDLELEGHTTCRVLSDTGVDTYFFYTTLSKFLTALWAIGAVCAMWVIFSSNHRFLGRLRYYRHALEGVDAPVPVYTAAHLPSPCLFGVFQPAVYLTPQAAEGPDTLRHVLAHELTHYAHKDHIWSLLRCLALALHWYNPLVWLAAALSKRDGELACDEGAVARLGEEARIPYGRTLVDMAAAQSLRPADLLSCSTAMTGGKKSIQRRVAALVKKPETAKTALFAVIALVALSLVFVFAGRKNTAALDEYRSAVEGLERVELAHYAVSTYVIEDPELLEQAKALLADIDPAGAGETADVEYGSPGITLFRSGPEGQDILMGYSYQLQIGHSGGVRVVRFLEGEPSSQYLAPCEVVGCLPDNAYERLAELAGQQENQTGSGSPELSRFLAGVERATAIRYGPPSYSSWFCPYPIADEDLLAAAKEVLNSAVSLGPDDPEPDRGTLIHASVITLMLEDGEEIYYTLQRQDDCTYILEGAVSWFEDSGQSPWYSAAYRCEGDAVSVLANLARQQQRLSQDPSFPIPLTAEELEEYTPLGIQREHGYQLKGWSGGLKQASFYHGTRVRSDDTIQLWYRGDEDHGGVWVLEIWKSPLSSHTSGYDIRSDLPMVVYNAGRYAREEEPYEQLGAAAFAASLRPEDVISVTAGDYGPGQAVKVDLQALKEQLVQGLYHQPTTEYHEEKHGQYVITVRVEKDVGYYLHDGGRDGLILSIGSEPDVVCLRHRILSVPDREGCEFVRSPELYHTIRNIFN